jgi:hypothetical protein
MIKGLNLKLLINQLSIYHAININNIKILDKIFAIKELDLNLLVNCNCIYFAMKTNNIEILNNIFMIENLDIQSLINQYTIHCVIWTNNIKILNTIYKTDKPRISMLMNDKYSVSSALHYLVIKKISISFFNNLIGIMNNNVFSVKEYIKLCNFIIYDPLSIFENSFGINKNNYNNLIETIQNLSHLDKKLYIKANRLLTRSKTKSKLFDDINMHIASFCI